MTNYTVKQLADLAKVSRRTLHYYDEIGLLKPEAVGQNGYRSYGSQALLRLQQILFFKELGFSLDQIRQVTSSPGFDLLRALELHHAGLLARRERLETLIETVEQTMMTLRGELPMDEKALFDGFSEEQQQRYNEEAVERWGDTARESIQKWDSYGKQKQAEILKEGEQVQRSLIEAMPLGPESAEAQQAVARWHAQIRNFYEPDVELLLGLADLFNDQPEYRATYEKLDPGLPEFFREAITVLLREARRQRGKS